MNARHILYVAGAMTFLALQLGGSCASSSDQKSSDDHYTSYDRPNRIPRSADMVREGTGKLKWTADMDGTFYVYNPERDRVAYSGPVRNGQEIVVLPDDDKVYVGGKVVSDKDIRRNDAHRIYFARTRDGGHDHGNHDGSVPKSASRVANGTGEISYKASAAGRIWVYDADSEKVILSRDVKRHQSIVVNPDRDRVTIDGKTVYDKNLERKNTHRIYFEKD